MSGRQDAVVTFTARELPGGIGLLSWLPAPRGVLCWVREDEGQAAPFTARFAELQACWSAFTARAAVNGETANWPSAAAGR